MWPKGTEKERICINSWILVIKKVQSCISYSVCLCRAHGSERKETLSFMSHTEEEKLEGDAEQWGTFHNFTSGLNIIIIRDHRMISIQTVYWYSRNAFKSDGQTHGSDDRNWISLWSRNMHNVYACNCIYWLMCAWVYKYLEFLNEATALMYMLRELILTNIYCSFSSTSSWLYFIPWIQGNSTIFPLLLNFMVHAWIISFYPLELKILLLPFSSVFLESKMSSPS